FLQVMRRQADEMALTSNGDLQGLANPPGRIRRQASAVADVEAVNGLHQTADGLLQQIGITEGVMAEALGNVSSETNVGGRGTMLQMDVTIVQPTNRRNIAGLFVTEFANELGHRPGFERGLVLSEFREVADQGAHQLTLRFPEIGEKTAFLVRRQQ